MITYSYHLFFKPDEATLQTHGAEGWRVIATGTDPRDGALAWALVERVDVGFVPEHVVPAKESRTSRR